MPPSFKYENFYRKEGYRLIAGADEVGRGSLAGPVVAAAVILDPKKKIKGLNDSKKLSAKQREKLFKVIEQKAVGIGVGVVDEKTIDRINITQASLLAIRLAMESLSPSPNLLLIDGRDRLPLPFPQKPIVSGDSISASIAAASIIAKVLRDRVMEKLDVNYPEYGFAMHKGYGTARHLRELKQKGPCLLHRRSYRPVTQPAQSKKRLDIAEPLF
ncbi:MAG: ribonuclease HII [Candidatus Margulisiibacteriota bacterium]